MVDMPKEHEYCRLRLVIEYNRLLACGKAVGLIDVPDESNIAVSLGTSTNELSGIISHIGWLLEQFRNIGERWKQLTPPEANEHNHADSADIDISVLSLDRAYMKTKTERKYVKGTNHLLRWMSKSIGDAKEIVTHPRRIRWVTVDKDAFEALLKDLHTLTGRLHELIGENRQGNLAEITSETYRELVITRNNVQELKDMLAAMTIFMRTSPATGAAISERRENTDEEFRRLLRLKKSTKRQILC